MADTSGTLSEALIASMAAGLLDEYKITSLDDPAPVARYMAREFGTVRREIQEAYPWTICRELATLTEDGTPPAFGFAARYLLPTLALRPFRLSCEGKFNAPPIPFKTVGRYIHCDTTDTVYLIYVKDITNVGTWTPLMGRAFAAKLAMYASQNVTGKIGYFEKCRTMFFDAMAAGATSDALREGSPETVFDGQYDGFSGFDSLSVRGGC